jgi:glycolate oxidase subunit GlcD
MAADLRRILGPEAVFDGPLDLALYAHDATLVPGSPDLVVLPETTEQVSQVVRYASGRGIPIVPRGCGTSLSGGPVPTCGGIVMSLTRMNRILRIDTANREVRVQPGVVNSDLQAALAPLGFLYAPDPSSQSVCSIGGNVAENAGGPHCLKYGVTANHVTGLEVVLSDGEVATVGSLASGEVRLDPTSLIVGSEGTLCIVTEVACRILPLPQAVVTMLAIFDSLEDASRAVSGIIASGIVPATLEMLDRPLIRAVQIAMDAGYPEDAEAVLIIELDGLQAGMERQLAQVEAICQAHHVRRFQWAADEAERALLWKGRKGTFGAVANISPGKLCSDVAVPRTELPYVLSRVVEMGAEFGLRVGNVFHAGDGNLHPQVLYDPRDPDEVRRAHELDEKIAALALERGGVLTGEHGIGVCKRQWMSMMFGPVELSLMWRIKDAFDPTGLLNPGKVLPERTEARATPPQASGPPSEPSADAIRPASIDELAEAVGAAAACCQRLQVRGAGTKSGAPVEGARVVDTTTLAAIVDVDPENLTITAQAGVRWADLQAAAARHGQRVPIFPRHRAWATVGGVLAADDAGPQRLRYGSCRDALLGVRLVLPSGEIARFGSRCVKNTSGYAVERLMVGSWGTLGVIAEAILRTFPLPERALTLILPVADRGALGGVVGAIRPLCEQLLARPLEITALELVSPSLLARAGGDATQLADSADRWCLVLALEGSEDEVSDVASSVRTLIEAHGLPEPASLCGQAHDDLWAAITDMPLPAVEIAARPTDVIPLAAALSERDPDGLCLRAGVGSGILCVGTEGRGESFAGHEAFRKTGPSFRWRPIPPAVRYDRPTETPAGGLAGVLHRLKNAFDAQHLLPRLI